MQGYYEQLYVNKFENLNEMNQFYGKKLHNNMFFMTFFLKRKRKIVVRDFFFFSLRKSAREFSGMGKRSIFRYLWRLQSCIHVQTFNKLYTYDFAQAKNKSI